MKRITRMFTDQMNKAIAAGHNCWIPLYGRASVPAPASQSRSLISSAAIPSTPQIRVLFFSCPIRA